MMDVFDKKKAAGPDDVSNWVLQECSSQLSEKICNLTPHWTKEKCQRTENRQT